MRVALLGCLLFVTVGCSRLRGKGNDAGPEAASEVAATGAPDVPSEPGIVPIDDPACVLRATDISGGTRPLVKLRAGGRAFASLDEVKEIEVRFAAGANGGTATVKTKVGSFAGEARLPDVQLAPKKDSATTPPWLVVHSLHPEHVDGDKVTVRMWVPQAVQAVMPLPTTYPCAELAIGSSPPDPPGADVAMLKKESELKTEGGEVIAKLVLPAKKPPPQKPSLASGPPEPSTFVVLERAGRRSKVRILGVQTSYEGWVDSAVLVKKTTQGVGMTGLTPPKVRPPIRVRCTEPIGVYVDDGDRSLRVGTLDPNALIESTRTDGVRSFIDLGAHSDFASLLSGEQFAHPYVRSKTIAMCPNAND